MSSQSSPAVSPQQISDFMRLLKETSGNARESLESVKQLNTAFGTLYWALRENAAVSSLQSGIKDVDKTATIKEKLTHIQDLTTTIVESFNVKPSPGGGESTHETAQFRSTLDQIRTTFPDITKNIEGIKSEIAEMRDNLDKLRKNTRDMIAGSGEFPVGSFSEGLSSGFQENLLNAGSEGGQSRSPDIDFTTVDWETRKHERKQMGHDYRPGDSMKQSREAVSLRPERDDTKDKLKKVQQCALELSERIISTVSSHHEAESAYSALV